MPPSKSQIFSFLKAENNLSMLFHRNIANRNGLKVPLPVFGSRFNRAQFYTLRRAGRHAEITAGAQIRHNGMHRARCAHNGVNRTRLNTFCAANAVGFVDNSKGTNRLWACSSPSTGWGSTFSRAAILSMTASPPGAQRLIFSPARPPPQRKGGSRGSRTARTGSGVKVHQFFNHRIVLHRKPAGGVTQNDAKDESQHADGRDGNQIALITTSPDH